MLSDLAISFGGREDANHSYPATELLWPDRQYNVGIRQEIRVGRMILIVRPEIHLVHA